MPSNELPRLYRDLARWWPLFSPPVHYAEEAMDILPTLMSATDAPPRTLLELGAGAGSLAWHLKPHFQLTLTDLSPQMLEQSRRVNPECEHIAGDMRTLDLRREFDLVMIHDAIMYLTEADSVRAAIATAYRHCRRGGAAIVMPDHVKETYQPSTEEGGEDGADGAGMRYLMWSWDPDPDDDTFDTAFSFVFRDADGTVHFDGEVHRCGLFSRDTWLGWFREAGFDAMSRIDPWQRDVFVARKP
jgi:SAM-dependent methyltransferase